MIFVTPENFPSKTNYQFCMVRGTQFVNRDHKTLLCTYPTPLELQCPETRSCQFRVLWVSTNTMSGIRYLNNREHLLVSSDIINGWDAGVLQTTFELHCYRNLLSPSLYSRILPAPVQVATLTFVSPPPDALPPLPEASLTVFLLGHRLMVEILISLLIVTRMLNR